MDSLDCLPLLKPEPDGYVFIIEDEPASEEEVEVCLQKETGEWFMARARPVFDRQAG